ncbi:MAG: tetratricopeptide repeat protein [Planctomycetes bacterium]|nr:tetratricopeptide repeat protein [Planctomycetota bacterium]
MRGKMRLLVVVVGVVTSALAGDTWGQFGPPSPMPGPPRPGPSSPGRGGYRPPSAPRPSLPNRPQPYNPARPSPPTPYNPGGSPYNPGGSPHNPGGSPHNPGGLPGAQPSRPSPYVPRSPHVGQPAIPFRSGNVRFGTPQAPRIYGRPPVTVGRDWQQAQSLIRQGQINHARTLIDQTLEQDRSLGGLMSVVWTMEQAGTTPNVMHGYRRQAYDLARQQANQGASTPLPWIAIAKFSLEDNKDGEFRSATETLIRQHPDHEYTHYFTGIRAFKDEDRQTAERELRKAKEMGVPAESIAALLKAAIDNQKIIWDYAWYTLWTIAGWVAGLAVLFLLGKVLSAATLRSIRRSDSARISFAQRLIRKSYRMVINLAGIYYFLSLPILVVLSIALPLSIGYALLMLPVISLYLVALVLIVGVGGLLTALSGIRACFYRAPNVEGERMLDAEEASALWQLVRGVADEVGTRPVDEIWITPGTDIAVFELGGIWRRMRNRGRRVLILGVATIGGLRQNAFGCILAHEFGHFRHRDTAGGDVALRVRFAMTRFADAIVARGPIRWWNLAVWFLRVYDFLFRRLTFGATRLQEVLSDRVAVRAYGPKAFREGLLHVVRRSVEFDQLMGKSLTLAVRGDGVSAAFYRPALRPDAEEREQIELAIEALVQRPSSEDDTHPSPRERFELADRIEVPNPRAESGMVWQLLPIREKLTAEMNENLAALLKAEATDIREVNRAVLKHLSAHLTQNPDPGAYEQRAALHVEQGRLEDALKDLDRVMETVPGYFPAQLGRAAVNSRLSRYEAAAADFEAVLKKFREARQAEIYYDLGVCYLRLKRFARAVEIFDRAIKHRSEYLAAQLGRAQALVGQQQFQAAIDQLDASIQQVPRSADAYMERGRAREKLACFAPAIEDYRMALRLEPNFTKARCHLAWLLATCPVEEFRDGETAARHARLACDANGDDRGLTLETLAVACAEIGDFTQAAQLAREAAPLLPKDRQSACQRRLLFYQQGKVCRIPAE